MNRPRSAYSPALLWAPALLLSVAVCAVAIYALAEMRNDAQRRAQELGSSISLALTRDIARNIELYDLSMQAAIEGVQRPDVMNSAPEIRQLVLFDRSTTASDLGSILVTDATGKSVLDSKGYPPRAFNVSDRDFFQAQAKSDAGLYISVPFTPRSAGVEPSIALSHRLSDRDGKFAGIVAGTLRLKYFARLFEGLEVGPHGSIALLRADGTGIARYPYIDGFVGQPLKHVATFKTWTSGESGSYLAGSSIDGLERFYTYRRVGPYPLIVVVGLATQDTLASWHARVWLLAPVIVVLALCFPVMAWKLSREFSRRQAAEDELKALVTSDALTGVGTRRALDEVLSVEWRRTYRQEKPLSLLMLDVDEFKQYNDHYGHQQGDRVLTEIGRCILQSLRRPGDFAGRYGGEEFCVILPYTDLAGAIEVAQTIRQRVESLTLPHAASRIGFVTVSVGAAEYDPHLADYVPPETILAAADKRLYEAKRGGRNLVVPAAARPSLYAV
ncbi:sensor domain-containing diguanylate cyclase [Ralstonia pickettii]|uniref:sensor domain-containing diguanylate cyclase n=1 Tax=Ralstonia pickettii TaxID=329 RepID=UPI002714F7CA|nr:sensor domain-containing diguanylate cyclase [Ralstonia pickettii]WKZ86482.1 sensor domain-containing diguanylate cyclase [Ralstonia pickettii]